MKKRTLLILAAFLTSLFALNGCRRSYRDTDVVGTWQYVTNRITQTYTFSPDHTFTCVTAGLRHFGEWRLRGDQLDIVTRSNSFSPTVVSNVATARIVELTPSGLILKDREESDEPRTRAMTRLR
jgi:hypothetical protein